MEKYNQLLLLVDFTNLNGREDHYANYGNNHSNNNNNNNTTRDPVSLESDDEAYQDAYSEHSSSNKLSRPFRKSSIHSNVPVAVSSVSSSSTYPNRHVNYRRSGSILSVDRERRFDDRDRDANIGSSRKNRPGKLSIRDIELVVEDDDEDEDRRSAED